MELYVNVISGEDFNILSLAKVILVGLHHLELQVCFKRWIEDLCASIICIVWPVGMVTIKISGLIFFTPQWT